MKPIKGKLKNVTNEEIEIAINLTRSPIKAAKHLGVSPQALYQEIKKRGKVICPTLKDLIDIEHMINKK